MTRPKQIQTHCQIVISGVGGQGVLFVTRLLAEAAIRHDLKVFTSETHGMAQRGGTVISHLKVGDFTSPLINPGRADGLVALKAECLAQHGGYLKPGGWAVVNSAAPPETRNDVHLACIDADRLVRDLGNPKALNLVMLGYALAGSIGTPGALHCTLEDVSAVLENRLKNRPPLLAASLRALRAGADG
ncbi:MAG TPA: indolepyruvate oxidoreductase subunit beta, partial [Desulfosarcina sp.]|nr:indolepyruvate oxidoreductase subunit beta [Desulfosarcina sp.]